MTAPENPSRDALYQRLVVAAYLLLAPVSDPRDRLAGARRLAADSLRARIPAAGDEQWVRFRGLARRATRRRLLPTVTWRRASHAPVARPPADVEHLLLDAHLAAATDSERLGYVLVVAEGLAPAAATVAAAAVAPKGTAPTELVTAGEALRDAIEAEGVTARRQRELLFEADYAALRQLTAPSASRLRARSAVRASIIGSTAVCAVIAGLLTIPGSPANVVSETDDRPPVVKRVGAMTWTTATTDLDLSLWPTRGSAASDEALVNRAVRAWLDEDDEIPPAREVQLLYAGAVTGRTVVLLFDGTRVARYVDGAATVKVDLATKPDVYGSSALALDDGARGVTYLLAPWVTAAKRGALVGDWTPLPVTDGVTAAVPVAISDGCSPRAVLQLRARSTNVPFTLADVGRLAPTHLMYIPPVIAGPVARPHELDADARGAYARLGCQLKPAAVQPTDSVNLWILWRGQLPEGGPVASVTCLRITHSDGSADVATSLLLATEPGARKWETGDAGRACSRSVRHVVLTQWWQTTSGKWYYLAVGSRNVTSISVSGLGVPAAAGSGLVAVGPFDQAGSRTAQVAAQSADGGEVAVLQAK